jgi:hypothetical protein
LTQITEDEVVADEPSLNQTTIEQLKTIWKNLDDARSSLSNNDNSKALQEIDSADSELLKVTQNLPP